MTNMRIIKAALFLHIGLFTSLDMAAYDPHSPEAPSAHHLPLPPNHPEYYGQLSQPRTPQDFQQAREKAHAAIHKTLRGYELPQNEEEEIINLVGERYPLIAATVEGEDRRDQFARTLAQISEDKRSVIAEATLILCPGNYRSVVTVDDVATVLEEKARNNPEFNILAHVHAAHALLEQAKENYGRRLTAHQLNSCMSRVVRDSINLPQVPVDHMQQGEEQ